MMEGITKPTVLMKNKYTHKNNYLYQLIIASNFLGSLNTTLTVIGGMWLITICYNLSQQM